MADNSDNLHQDPTMMYVLTSVLCLVCIVPVALRLRVRMTQKQGPGVDDWLIIPALIGALGTAAATFDATAAGGLGLHTPILPSGAPDYTEATATYLKTKSSAELLADTFLGLFRGKPFNIVSWTMIGIVIAWTVAFFFAHLFECVPIDANWSSNGMESTCINEIPMYIGGAWSDVIIDAIILIMPIPIIWNLQMTMRRKFALSGIFLLGALTVMSSMARMIFYYRIQTELSSEGGADITWIIAPTFYWPMIESSLGILGACLPTLRPLFVGFSPESMMRSFRSIITLESRATGTNVSKTGSAARSHGSSSHEFRTSGGSQDGKHGDYYDLKSLPNSLTSHGGITVERTFDLA